MNCVNEMSVRFLAVSENEAFARICVASFCSILNPTIDEIGDIKTAVSEAVTNSIVHAYPSKTGYVDINIKLFSNNEIYISIKDYGVGIVDIDKAREPFYTSKPTKDRSGMGFTVMEGFMDSVDVISKENRGVEVILRKKIVEEKYAYGGWFWKPKAI